MASNAKKPAYHGKRILVVDDEEDIRETVAEMLEGARIEEAGTAAEARAKLSSGTYDLVILDIMGVEGLEILDELGGRMPAIVLTAHALSPTSLRRSMRGGARLFLPKYELGRLDQHAEQVLGVAGSHWRWLFDKVDFGRAFGAAWSGLKGAMLAAAHALDTIAERSTPPGIHAAAGPVLMQHLDLPDADARALAAGALGMYRYEEALPKLRDLARKDPSAEVRKEAAWAVAEIERVHGKAKTG